MIEQRRRAIMLILILADCAVAVNASRADFKRAIVSQYHWTFADDEPGIGQKLWEAIWKEDRLPPRIANTNVEDWL